MAATQTSDFWTVFGAIATAAAAVATVVAVIYARSSARDSRKATEAARETVTIADAARRADERDRLRHRFERVGELVERVFWSAESATQGEAARGWMQARNDLNRALVGLHDRLPKCATILTASSAAMALRAASDARAEVEMALGKVDVEADSAGR